MKPVDHIIAYLDGKTSLKNFYDEVMQNDALQKYLEQDVNIPPYTKEGSLFLYIMDLNLNVASSDINAKDALSKLLDIIGVDHKVDQSSLRDYEMILAASPAWLSLPEEYITDLIKKIPCDLGQSARVKKAREFIAENFHYLKKPPKWMQSPSWLFANGNPMIFVGQMDLDKLLHDDAYIYIFYEPNENKFHTVTQVA